MEAFNESGEASYHLIFPGLEYGIPPILHEIGSDATEIGGL